MGFSLGHLLIILIIVLVLFGAGKLPQMMSDMGKGMKAFKNGIKDEENTIPKLKAITASASPKKAPVKAKAKKKASPVKAKVVLKSEDKVEPKTKVVLKAKPKAATPKKTVAKKTVTKKAVAKKIEKAVVLKTAAKKTTKAKKA